MLTLRVARVKAISNRNASIYAGSWLYSKSSSTRNTHHCFPGAMQFIVPITPDLAG